MSHLPSPPDAGKNPLLDFLYSRRSASALGSPGPSHEQLKQILSAAGTVPDHGQLRPFRFVVVAEEGRDVFGQALADAAREHKPQLTPQALDAVRAKTQRSPTLIVLIASPKPGKIEAWEQIAAASCSGFALVLAAHALGVGAVWKNVPFTRGQALTSLLGLGPEEQMLGWVHLGTSLKDASAARPPLDWSSVTALLDASAVRPFQP
jgi:nitroreductase